MIYGSLKSPLSVPFLKTGSGMLNICSNWIGLEKMTSKPLPELAIAFLLSSFFAIIFLKPCKCFIMFAQEEYDSLWSKIFEAALPHNYK